MTCPLEVLLGSSYGPYLVIPRSALQSMPQEWKEAMADLLDQLFNRLDDANLGRTVIGYEVLPVGREGVVVDDPLKEFAGGTRNLFAGTQEV